MLNNQIKFKQTEIGEIPQDWSVAKLSDLIEIIGGGTPKTTEPEYWDGDIPWLSVVDFNDENRFVCKTEKTISEKGLKNSSTKILKKGQIIISARGTVGALAQLGLDMAFNQSCYGISGKNISNDFLYYCIKNSINRIKQNVHGAVFDTITKETFDSLLVGYPDIEKEQNQIVSILSSLDDKIELNQKTIKTLEEIGQTLFKRWFIDFEFPNEKGEPFKSSGGEMVDSELGEIPKGWCFKKLSDISNITIGRTPPRLESKWFSKNEQDIKWISIRDMGNAGTYIYETSEYLTKEAIDKFRVPIIPKNTVILSFKLTVGRVSITTEDMVSNEAIAHIKLTESRYSPEYIYLLLKKFDFTSLGSTSSIATAVNSVSIKNIPILAPDTQVVDEFSNIVKSIFSEIFVLTQETKNLKLLSNSLLPNLLSGKIKV